jgi:hypothetical protein
MSNSQKSRKRRRTAETDHDTVEDAVEPSLPVRGDLDYKLRHGCENLYTLADRIVRGTNVSITYGLIARLAIMVGPYCSCVMDHTFLLIISRDM